MRKAHITNIQCPSQRCGFGEGATWDDAVADALAMDQRAYIGGDGCVYIDTPVAL